MNKRCARSDCHWKLKDMSGQEERKETSNEKE